MANRQQKSFRNQIRKSKKIHEGNLVAVVTGYRGKTPLVADQFREHGPYAFKPDLEAIARRRAQRLKLARRPQTPPPQPTITQS